MTATRALVCLVPPAARTPLVKVPSCISASALMVCTGTLQTRLVTVSLEVCSKEEVWVVRWPLDAAGIACKTHQAYGVWASRIAAQKLL